MDYYAGIGSRKTPLDVCGDMTGIAEWLRGLGLRLRSGGAVGADSAFENGAAAKKRIYYARHATPAAIEMASRFHPAWHRCSPIARQLLGRNCMQILGDDLRSPSRFVACWTEDGKDSGGTGLAIRVATHNAIPIFNLHDSTAAERLRAFALSIKES